MHLTLSGVSELPETALTYAHVEKDPTTGACAGIVCHTQVNTIALLTYVSPRE